MNLLYITLAVLSVPAALIVSNMYRTGFREARGIAMYLSDKSLLREIVTIDLLQHPPEKFARFAQPTPAGYEHNVTAFRQSDFETHCLGRYYLRIAMFAIVIGSGVVGFLAFGWFGLPLPIINLIAMTMTFNASTEGRLDNMSLERAAEHVQIIALVLSRWYAANPEEAARWVKGEPSMKLLSAVVTGTRD